MPPTERSSYLLTEDLGEKIEAFRHLEAPLLVPEVDSQYVVELQDGIASVLQEVLGEEHPVVRIKMRELAHEIMERVFENWGHDVLVVSTCPEIARPFNGETIEINRLVDGKGVSIGLGPRPGHLPLVDQFKRIHALSKKLDKDVVLAEDGVFEGHTMAQVIKGLQNAGVSVRGVVAGFAFSATPVKAIQDENGVMFDFVRQYGPIEDWVPDHDFIPLVPGCGKVVGESISLGNQPLYKEDVSYCVPYVYPYESGKWASIPAEKFRTFSAGCLNLAQELFKELEKLNGRDILVGDILHSSQQWVGIPHSIVMNGTATAAMKAEKNTRVLTHLKYAADECL